MVNQQIFFFIIIIINNNNRKKNKPTIPLITNLKNVKKLYPNLFTAIFPNIGFMVKKIPESIINKKSLNI